MLISVVQASILVSLCCYQLYLVGDAYFNEEEQDCSQLDIYTFLNQIFPKTDPEEIDSMRESVQSFVNRKHLAFLMLFLVAYQFLLAFSLLESLNRRMVYFVLNYFSDLNSRIRKFLFHLLNLKIVTFL